MKYIYKKLNINKTKKNYNKIENQRSEEKQKNIKILKNCT